jgi:hypothetical protein
MKYLEFTFHTTPCTEIVNDVLSAVLGEAGFESFVEQTDGVIEFAEKSNYFSTEQTLSTLEVLMRKQLEEMDKAQAEETAKLSSQTFTYGDYVGKKNK